MQKEVQVTVNAAIALAVACVLIGVIVCKLLNGLADINESIERLERKLDYEVNESIKRLERKIDYDINDNIKRLERKLGIKNR
jgi:hypothetical protein